MACGTPPNRRQTLADLQSLEKTREASIDEAIGFIENESLYGLGCGLVDTLLLASAIMTPSTLLWTLDKRLSNLALRYDVQFVPNSGRS